MSGVFDYIGHALYPHYVASMGVGVEIQSDSRVSVDVP